MNVRFKLKKELEIVFVKHCDPYNTLSILYKYCFIT